MLKFATFTSNLELPFYTSLASNKINHDRLDDSARRLLGLYEVRPHDPPESSCRLQIHGNALTSDSVPAGFCRAEGMIKNVNTIEDYRNLDKAAILSQAARTVWDAIIDGTIFSCPSLLASFSVICYADLKRYRFTYLFAFPALHSEPAWQPLRGAGSLAATEAEMQMSEEMICRMTSHDTAALVDAFQTWRYRVDDRQHGFFLAKRQREAQNTKPGSLAVNEGTSLDSKLPSSPSATSRYTWIVGSLGDYETGFFEGVPLRDRFICFLDPSTFPNYPGWMLRNLLVLIRRRWKLDRAQIICYRDTQARRDDARSIILSIGLDSSTLNGSSISTLSLDPMDMPRVTGWERNSSGKVISRVANLGEHMDPQRLADQAVDLNLKLIKWRIAPGLDLDIIKNTRCLLLGAGTLGSYVSRNLMGWGVRTITFVDNGAVSYSNPVRQPLFNFSDCVGGGVKKAHRASKALKDIYPGVNSKGYLLSVPMAGHPVMDEAAAKTDFEMLDSLIEEHDAIFLLMDTRESRWLPTVMGKAKGKMVMNAALGFDTFVVMRQGATDSKAPLDELGCYFCNDVVAPADSVADRTLDQQCTVTRPGIAAMASALLVEIFVSLLQDPLGILAPAPLHSTDEPSAGHPLGLVPHQIRGSLSNFQNIIVRGKSYDSCSACSARIIHAFKTDGWHFVKKALNEKGYVENLSGLAETSRGIKLFQVQRAAEKAFSDMDMNISDYDSNESGEGELI